MLVSNKNFLIGEIQKFNPLSIAYRRYWKDEKLKVIEGEWSCGKWMPGPLYFFVNHWHIELSENEYSKSKIIAKPFLRDLEWERGYIHAEARGFSGFADDTEFTCLRKVRDYVKEPTEALKKRLPPTVFNAKGELKTYVEAREYLRKIHSKSLGRPLYQNEARNVIDIESRGTGKSFWMACLIAHNFLFDGST